MHRQPASIIMVIKWWSSANIRGAIFCSAWCKSPLLLINDLTTTRTDNWISSVRLQNCGFLSSFSCLHLSQLPAWSLCSSQYDEYAFCNIVYSAAAVTWCACLVLDTCDAFKKESAFPGVAMSAWTRAAVHPLLSNHFQISIVQPSAFHDRSLFKV